MNTSTRNNAEILSSQNQSKLIQDRVQQTEKYFGDMCDIFGALSRKEAKIRDKRDELSKTVFDYGESDTVRMNSSTKLALKDFSQNLAAMEDYRQALIERIDAKVIAPLSTYGETCKNTREDLKKSFTARDKEAKQKKNVDKVKEKHPSDRKQISQAETELQRATVDASRSEKALEEQMDSFEQKRIQDIKKVLSDFVTIEMHFHAKALELCAKCHNSLTILNEEEDLEEFRNSMRPQSAASRLEKIRAISSSQNSLISTSQPNLRGTPAASPHTGQKKHDKASNLSNTMYDEEEEGEESEEDVSYEDDDDESDHDAAYHRH